MPTLEVEIKTVGATEAATDIKDVGDAAKQAGGDIKSAGSDISSTSQSLSSFKSNLAGVVGSFTAVATGVLNLVRNFTQLEQAQIRVDTANRRVETSAQAVEKAQKNLNDAIAKYGAGSTEAAAAAAKLKTAIEGHQIAVDRAQLQQAKFNETLASLATEIAPNVIGVFGSIVGAISSFTTKGEGGVTLAGKLKQSFLDLVSGGSNLKSGLDSAGTAMGGLGTKAESAGKSAGTLKNEVVQLGTGITQAIPGVANFGGGLTNTAVAAERTAGPLGNVERSVASTAAEVGGAVAPLGAFAGGMGATGTAAEGAVGGLEAAAASTGALEGGTVAATAATAGLETGILGISAATAAETAGISLAVAALVLYVTNIGGFRDKTNAAIDSAQKFLAIGWSGFTAKFKPVTDAIAGAIKGFEDLIGKAGDFAKLDVSGQFKKQNLPPGQQPGPSGRPLDTDIAGENAVVAKGTAGLLAMVDAMKQLADQRVRMEGLSKTSTANSNANAEAFRQEQQAAQSLATTEAQRAAAVAQHAAAMQQAIVAERERKIAITDAFDAMKQVEEITKQAAAAAGEYRSKLVESNAESQTYISTLDSLDKSIGDSTGAIRANNEILGTAAGQQKLYTDGWNGMIVQLQNAQKHLIESGAALDALNANLQSAQITAYNQGWVDFNTTLDQTNVTAAHTQGVFDAFVASLGTSKQVITDMNAGFTSGEADVQKWAENLLQAQSKVDGTRSALEKVIPKLTTDFPQGVNLSNAAMMKFAEAVTSGSDAITKTLQDADKQWVGILDDFNKAMMQAPKDQSKAWAEFQKAQKSAFDELQKGLQSHTGNQQQVWATYYQKIGEAQQKFNTDSQQSWTKYFQDLNDKLQTPLTAGEQALIQSMAKMDEIMKKGIATLNQDLVDMKFDLPGSATKMQTDFNALIVKMEETLKTLPPAAQSAYQPLIDFVNRLPTATQEDWNKKVAATKALYEGILNPTQSFATTSDNVGKALNTQGPAADKASQGIKALSLGMQAAVDLNTGFARGVDDAVGSLNKLEQAGTTAFTHFAPALANVAAMFNTAFARGVDDAIGSLNKLEQAAATSFTGFGPALEAVTSAFNTAFARASSDAIGSINTLISNVASALQGFGPALQGITVAFNQAFARAASDAIGSINTMISNVASALQGFGPALQGITVAFNQAFARAASDAVGSINAMIANVASALAGFGPALQGITVAFNQAFAQAAQDAAGSMNSLAQQVQADIQNMSAAVNAIASVFNTVFSRAAQDAAGSVNSLAQQVQTDMQNIGSAVNAIASSFNTAFQKGAQDAAGSINQLAQQVQTDMQQIGQSVQQIAQQINQSFQQAMQQAGQAVQQFVQTINQIPRQVTINVTANTQQAQQAISALQNQLNQLRAAGGAAGVPMGFARTGGEFALTPGGFKRTKRGDELHAAQGGSFIITKEMRLANLTVGEGNKPELLTFKPAKGGRGIGMLIVTPIKVPKGQRLHAQSGGTFGTSNPNLAGGPQGLFGFTAGAPAAEPGAPIDYGAGIPAPVQTVGQGGPQQYPPSTAGPQLFPPSTSGNAVQGPVTAPPANPVAGGPGALIPGGPSGTTTGTAANVSPYEMAQMTGQAVASEQAPQQRQMQSDIADLLSAVRRLISKISMRDINANLMIDGQKMASTVSKYIGSGAYGGR